MTQIVFRGGDAEGQVVVIPETGVTVGRNTDCDLPIVEPSVSGHHGSIRFEHGEWWVHDNNSSNGTSVNDVEIRDSVIHHGDVLRFGNVEAVFQSVPDSPPAATDLKPEAGTVAPPSSSASADAAASEAGPKDAGREPMASSPGKEAGEKAGSPAPDGRKPAKPTDAKAKEPSRPAPNPAKDAPPEGMAADDVAQIADLSEKYARIKAELAEVIVGQSSVVEEVLIAIFSRGHALLIGVPGLAKTLLISTLSRVLDLGFKRVQFTPDLMPSDITGTDVLEEDKVTGQRAFRFVKGPLFTNMLLADEINRTPPKTQAALLEAMQEHHITVGSRTYPLSEPFFVLATQNPIEQEGTYPLPEAQLDRFLFNIVVDYPSAEEESRIITNVTGSRKPTLSQVLDGESVIRIQDMLRRVPVAPHVIDFARNLARATRPGQPEAPDFVKEMVGWGAGPRAGISLIQSAKARAVLHGRHHVTTGDVTAVALPVLRHRVITTFAAEAAGVKSDDVIGMLLKALKPREELDI